MARRNSRAADAMDELELQIRINEAQLKQLQDALFIERWRLIALLLGVVFVIALLSMIVLLLAFGEAYSVAERYSAIINIGAVFALFGLFEAFGSVSNSLGIIRQFRQLISAQIQALSVARSFQE